MLSTYQKGLSPIGWLVVICLFALFLVSGLKLIPHYMDFGTLKSVYGDINNQPNINTQSPQDVFSTISKALAINSVRDFKIAESTVISREGGEQVVGLDYEVREHLFGNLHVVLVFQYMPD